MPRISAASYARYIGRVGALAVALGVGIAVGTNGSGLAWAQTDSAGGSPGADEQSQTTPNEGSGTDTAGDTVPGDPDPVDPGNDGAGDEGSDAGIGNGTDSGMEVDAAGVDTSDNDAGQATDGTAGTAADGEDSDGDDVLGSGDKDSGDKDSGDKDTERDPVQNPVPSDAQDQTAAGLNKNTRRQATSPVVTSADGTGVDTHRTPDADAGTVTSSRLTVARGGGGADVNDDSGTRPMAAAAVVDEAQPDPMQSLLAIPGTVVEAVTSFVGALLSPFLTPGPGTPAEPPFLWALLGWVNREIQRTFFNRSPQAVTDDVTTSEDATDVEIDVLDNDVDPDADRLTVTGATALHGSVTVNEDSTLSYTPNANYNGDDTITYTLSDAESGWHIHGLGGLLGLLFGGNAGHAVTGTVNVDVKAVNDAPVANDDAASTEEDTPVSGKLLDNDSDVDGDQLTTTLETGAKNGTAVVNADGTYTYTPAANYHGEDSFTYKLSDGTLSDTAKVTVTVNSVEDAPVGANDSYSTAEDTAFTIPAPGVLGNDTDGDKDPLTVTVGAAPAHGGLTLNSDGSFTYTPAKDFNGADGFTYTVSDGTSTSAPVTVAITVTPVNDKPVANDDEATVSEDSDVAIDVLDNDTDADGDVLTVTTTAPGTTVNADGTITYKPAANTSGVQTFEYTVTDGHGGTATATVSVTVTAAPDAPVAVPDPLTVAEDGSLTITPGDLLDNDSDADGDPLSVVIKSQPDPAKGKLTLNADGVTYTYTPVKDFNGTDSFTYAASDGVSSSATVTVTIAVTPANDAPVATDDEATTNEDTAVTIDVLKNDTDVDGDKLTVSTSAVGAVVNSDGTITYTPGLNTNGDQTFTYTVSDGHGGTDEGSVKVSVIAQNDAPAAVDDSASTDARKAIAIDVRGNDTDIDGDTLSVQSVSDPAGGSTTVTADGKILYTPDAGFNGTDTFTYTISDGHGGTATANVTVTVKSAAPPAVITFADGAATRDVFIAGTDPTKIYVRTSKGDLRIVDTTTGEVTKTIALGGSVQSMTLSADGKFAYVGRNQTDFTIYEKVDQINTETGEIRSIGGVKQPEAMQLSDSGDTLYVSNLQTGTISVINIATGNFTEINVGLQTFAFAVGGGKLYAGRLINDLQVVDLATRNQTNVKTGDQGVFAAVMDIALAPGFAYVTDPLANKLVVVDRSNNTVVDRLDVGAGPSSVAVSSDGDFVFVANAQGGSVSVIDTARALVALTFPVGTNPTQLDLSADGKTLYVTTSAGVKVIPTADIYLVTGSGGDGPGWDVGAGTGIDTDPVDPTLPTLPGGGLGGGVPITPPIPGGPVLGGPGIVTV